MTDRIIEKVEELAERAKNASVSLGLTTEEERNAALQQMADALRDHRSDIIAANRVDMEAAAQAGTSEALLDRLMLDESRIEAMASALEELKDLPDPLGVVVEDRILYNGIRLQRVKVPLGVVAIVFEARPNVCADAAGICLKSGNACILRGGSLAAASNEAIAAVLAEAAVRAGMPPDSICALNTTDRSATDALMQLHGLIDVLIPRGGAGLIRHCVETSKIPVIETGTGNCHVYVHGSADPDKVLSIVMNAKCRRYGVCNACESLLVDRGAASLQLPAIMEALSREGVFMHLDDQAAEIAHRAGLDEGLYDEATEKDWETEYLGPEIAIRCVEDIAEAIDHINRYGTKHSEAIVAEDVRAQDEFLERVDAAAVYANASTAFTDGGQFGLGAEIGISTQKLHVRGPFALDALTSYKYLLRGAGQVRD